MYTRTGCTCGCTKSPSACVYDTGLLVCWSVVYYCRNVQAVSDDLFSKHLTAHKNRIVPSTSATCSSVGLVLTAGVARSISAKTLGAFPFLTVKRRPGPCPSPSWCKGALQMSFKTWCCACPSRAETLRVNISIYPRYFCSLKLQMFSIGTPGSCESVIL